MAMYVGRVLRYAIDSLCEHTVVFSPYRANHVHTQRDAYREQEEDEESETCEDEDEGQDENKDEDKDEDEEDNDDEDREEKASSLDADDEYEPKREETEDLLMRMTASNLQ